MKVFNTHTSTLQQELSQCKYTAGETPPFSCSEHASDKIQLMPHSASGTPVAVHPFHATRGLIDFYLPLPISLFSRLKSPDLVFPEVEVSHNCPHPCCASLSLLYNCHNLANQNTLSTRDADAAYMNT